MKLSDFDYTYPEDLVASYPLPERSASKMMVLDRASQQIQHRNFKDLGDYFKAGDVLILNDSRVFPCRLIGKRSTGGKAEFFLVHPESENHWECLVSPSKKISRGEEFVFDNQLKIIIENDDQGSGARLVRLEHTGDLHEILNQIGHVPLPPYLKRSDDATDPERYQTVYAKHVGSVAAPTAGFHFDEKTLQGLAAQGVKIGYVTLHVGLGTFLPIRCDEINQHQMHAESFSISQETAQLIKEAKRESHRVTVVGTTAVRALESAATGDVTILKTGPQVSNKFIYPPYQFKLVDRLLTNFHQPRSTLIVLVSAFASREIILEAYRQAIHERYRLFSYGDCLFIE